MLEPDFRALASTTVRVEPLTGQSQYGAPTYGTASTWDVYAEAGSRLVTTPDRKEEVAAMTLIVMSSSAVIGTQDRVTFRGRQPRILRVDRVDDEEGQHHLEVLLGS